MVITRTHIVAVGGIVAITSGLGVLCVFKIVEFKTIIEVVLSVCAHNGMVAATHGLVKPGTVVPGH